ncbi:MAG TPA: NAD(P)-dependent oxidoreductase [bacterium]|nr:NAD(P)-dependent oxidoreductase [bacterium]HOL47801.1 NAD(P)-dependent oxidoreductase [bacterium]HPQ19091.1 NAD(P)-dependent oxidoreductase [bacterium]
MSKKILLTGGTGFIGKNLILDLLKNNYLVYCLTRRRINLQNDFILKKIPNEKLNNLIFIQSDLTEENSLSKKIPDDVNVILHFAGITKAINPDDYTKGNFIGTKNLIDELLRKQNTKLRFIYCSSQAAAGPANNIEGITEENKPTPVSLYGKAKLEAEKYLLSKKEFFNWTIIRPSAVFGRGDEDFKNIYKLVKLGFNIKFDETENYFNLIYVQDLVNITTKLITEEKSYNKILFVNDGMIYSNSSFALTLARYFNKKIRTIKIPFTIISFLANMNELLCKIKQRPHIFNTDKVKELKHRYWLATNKKLLELFPDYKFYNIQEAICEIFESN